MPLCLRGQKIVAIKSLKQTGNLSIVFTLLLLLIVTNFCYSQTSTDATVIAPEVSEQLPQAKKFQGNNDTTRIHKKNFNESEVENLKSDPELNYKEAPTVAESLWDRFLSWLNQLLISFFENATMTTLGRVLMYSMGAIALIIIIMALLKVNAFRLFRGNADHGKFKYNVFHDNIHEMDFEKLIQDAVDKKEFRIGTRLIFLYALKLLSEKHLIQWQAGKTNHDYVEEIKSAELKTGLNELSFYFDYAWYGNFSVSPDQYQKVYSLFKTWKEKIN